MPLIVTLSDSRGRGLGRFLRDQDLPGDPIVEDFCIPGADYQTLYQKLKHLTTPRNESVLVVLYAGICSFTHKSGTVISYPGEKKALAQESIDSFITYCRTKDYTLVLATVIPADLERANRHRREGLEEEQKQLEADISDINEYIIGAAKDQNLPYLNLHREVSKRSKKRKRGGFVYTQSFTYIDLPDGVHPNSTLTNTLFTKVAGVCRYFLQSSYTESDSTQSESETNWDFKRQKHQNE